MDYLRRIINSLRKREPGEKIGMCQNCRRDGMLVKRRSILVPKVSNLPIISNEELCRECITRIAAKALNENGQTQPESTE